MPKPEYFHLAVSDAVGAGGSEDVFRYRDKTTQFGTSGGAITGTYHLEVSNDGSTWVQAGLDVTAAGYREITGTWRSARVRTSVGGLNLVATFAGQDFQAG